MRLVLQYVNYPVGMPTGTSRPANSMRSVPAIVGSAITMAKTIAIVSWQRLANRSSVLSYDIYLHQEKARDSSGEPNRIRLLYFKPACSQGDVKSRFYLHVVPVSQDSLSDKRKGVGYDVLDFSLDDFGGMSNGSCFVVRELPEYDILEIRMGELSAEGENLWEGRYALDK